MPLAPHQLLLAGLEIALVATGAWLLSRAAGVPEYRNRLLLRSRLPAWALTGAEVTLLALMILLLGTIGQALAQQLFGTVLKHSSQRAGLEVLVYGVGFHGVALLGWPLFWLARKYAFSDYGSVPPAIASNYREPLAKVGVHALSTLAIALPVLALTSYCWNLVLHLAGLPLAPQDLLGVFGNVTSPWLLVAMLFVACVLAPINEELLFRGAIFRFCRQRFGRGTALVISASLFGLMHGNWASFLPLAVLGMILALAYERTGDIRVSMLAHGLFNLNTLAILLTGLIKP